MSVPGPGIPLVAAVVFTGISEGLQGGLYAALIGTMYEMVVYCYSSGLFRVTPENGMRIATFAASAAFAAALVGILRKRAENQTYALAKQRTAAALEEERKHLQNILQQLPLGVLVSDAESGEITFANDRALAILGVNLGRLHSIGHPTMFHVESGRSYGPDEWPWRRCIQLRQAIDQDFLFAREDGELVAIGARACPVTTEDGKPIAAIMAFKRGMELR
ncbi:MAG: PAS domain-containing protein [Bryobacteraceae bacterium]